MLVLIRRALRGMFWDRAEPLPERVFFLVCTAILIWAAATGSTWGYAGLGVLAAILAAWVFVSWPERPRKNSSPRSMG